MFARILTPVAVAGSLLLGASPAEAQANRPPVAPPTATATSATAADRAAADMARLQRARLQKLGEKRQLERTYEAQLRELDRLYRGKASWNQDRQLRSKKAESKTTADRLSRVDSELRNIDVLLRRQRQALLAAIDRELALRPAAARRAMLDRMRAHVTAALEPRVRKILVPDDTLDRMADPEELTVQIELIARAEAELRRERESLRQREDRYARMARLRDLRERAKELSELEEDVGRRTVQSGTRAPGSASDDGRNQETATESDSPPSGGDSDEGGGSFGESGGPGSGGTGGTGGTGGSGGTGGTGGVGEDSGFEQSSILLTDVVDSNTIDALRRAGRSPSPRTRADAAARARQQVEARLQRLERSRALIQRHLGQLRQGK